MNNVMYSTVFPYKVNRNFITNNYKQIPDENQDDTSDLPKPYN